MSNEERVAQLNEELGRVIDNYCNKIGCADCPLDQGNSKCRATILQDRIYEAEKGKQ